MTPTSSAKRSRDNREVRQAFLRQCHDALKRQTNRLFDMKVRVPSHRKILTFDMATPELDIVVKCKVFKRSFGLSASVTTLREAVEDLETVQGNPVRLLIVSCNRAPQREETIGQCFVRLSRAMFHRLAILELPEGGTDLVCIHGNLGPDWGLQR